MNTGAVLSRLVPVILSSVVRGRITALFFGGGMTCFLEVREARTLFCLAFGSRTWRHRHGSWQPNAPSVSSWHHRHCDGGPMSSSKQEDNERSCLTVLKREPDGALPNSFRTFRALANNFRTVWSLRFQVVRPAVQIKQKPFGMRRVLTHVLEHSSHKSVMQKN